MDRKLKIAMIILIEVVIAIIIVCAVIAYVNKKEDEGNAKENVAVVEETNTNENDVMVINVDKQEEEEEEEEEEPEKDAATLTQEIYDLNMEIGTLYIPKTGLTTSVYCNSSVDKMEEMPCFLYTTGGLNKTGVTLFVGHNRMNGKLFSNNDTLSEGDIFYFTDYEGQELEYTIYSIFTTTESDTSFLMDDVDGPVIALSCCTDANDEHRLIVMGKANN